jgi:hypothetical protein
VQDASGAASRDADILPGFGERDDGAWLLVAATAFRKHSPEYPRLDRAGLLPPQVFHVLRFQQPAQAGGRWEDAAIAVLGAAGIQAHLAGPEIDLSPQKRQDFRRDAPAR